MPVPCFRWRSCCSGPFAVTDARYFAVAFPVTSLTSTPYNIQCPCGARQAFAALAKAGALIVNTTATAVTLPLAAGGKYVATIVAVCDAADGCTPAIVSAQSVSSLSFSINGTARTWDCRRPAGVARRWEHRLLLPLWLCCLQKRRARRVVQVDFAA